MPTMQPGVEMYTRARPPSIFAQIPSTGVMGFDFGFDIDGDGDEWEDERSDSGSEFEEDSPVSPRESFDSVARTSETTVSSLDEAPTPMSARKGAFNVQIRRMSSTQGPKGPHLFRASVDSAKDFQFDFALQMSPVAPYEAKEPATQLDEILMSPVSALAETPRPYKDFGAAVAEINATSVQHWTSQQVATWMYSAGFESAIIRKFEEQEVNGSVLLDLKFEDLKEFGIPSFGKRYQIWSELAALRPEGTLSPARTTFEDTCSCTSHDVSTPVTSRKRRLKKTRANINDPITPAESVSIVAIEQLLPRPHKCSKGEDCPKYRRQRRLREQLDREHGFAISPTRGGEIFIAGNPGDAQFAQNIVDNVVRPFSDAMPSVVASSDLLGPGEQPEFSLQYLQEDTLKGMDKRDPQESVKQFLNFQGLRGPAEVPPTPPAETPRFEMFPPAHPQLPKSHTNLRQLPKLAIPRSASAGPTNKASPLRQSVAPTVPRRLGTPASEMDVPITSLHALDPVGRDTSQSVPPNMHFRKPVKHRPGSRDPAHWQRASFAMPTVPENSTSSPLMKSPVRSPIRVGYKALYGSSTTHAGYMRKRRTKLLRHEWAEQHCRLQGSRLAMHNTHKIEDRRALETIDIDDYAVACQSLASSSKLAAALKSLKLSSGKEQGLDDSAFIFQLVPAVERARFDRIVKGELKTHQFAVKSRDDRIDWMREVMVAKALSQKRQGYEVEVNRDIV